MGYKLTLDEVMNKEYSHDDLEDTTVEIDHNAIKLSYTDEFLDENPECRTVWGPEGYLQRALFDYGFYGTWDEDMIMFRPNGYFLRVHATRSVIKWFKIFQEYRHSTAYHQKMKGVKERDRRPIDEMPDPLPPTITLQIRDGILISKTLTLAPLLSNT